MLTSGKLRLPFHRFSLMGNICAEAADENHNVIDLATGFYSPLGRYYTAQVDTQLESCYIP